MKKITLALCFLFVASMFTKLEAQVLNENANWPNANWTLTGTYTVSAGPDLSVEADPTVDANFAFDDDDAGNGSDDSIAAESPVIDLTAAFNAGETWLTVSVDYVYRKFSVEEFLRFQYYDADAMIWVNWEPESMPGNDNALTDDFCSGTALAYTTTVLNIAGFSGNQQSGFRYRILFDDDPAGPAWEYGFCFNSPTITSATPPSCPDPISLAAVALNTTEASLSWTEIGSASLWNIELLDITAGDTQTMTATNSGVTNPFGLTGLTPGNDYEFYVQADCGGDGTSNWSGPFAWTQPNLGEVCESAIVVGALPYSTTDDTANYGDNYSGAPGTDCGTVNNYLNGDDVVYEYTATADTSINVSLSNIGSTYAGVFAYNDCSDIGVMCATIGDNYDFNDGIVDLEFDLTVTTGETYYIVISTWATPQSTTYTLNITENTCTDATVTYTVVDDCANSGGFNILVDVTDLGSSTSLDIDDDQGSATQSTGVVGMFTFGPYVNGTDVIISITDNDDSNCDQMSGTLTQVVCPPDNVDCSTAEVVTVGVGEDGPIVIGTNDGAGDSGVPEPSCNAFYAGGDIWYEFTPPVGAVEVNVDVESSSFSSIIAAVYDNCTDLNEIYCLTQFSSSAIFNITGLTGGTTYYLRFYDFSNDDIGPITFNINTPALSIDDYENSKFTYFPNPVKNELTVKAQNNIQNISVFNMLGQEVLKITPNTLESSLDMSSLSQGAYFVKVTINNASETIRIIKN